MKKKVPWGRTDKLTAVGVVIAILAIVVGLLFPEVRRFVGLEKPAPVALVQTQAPKSEPPATATPNATTPQAQQTPSPPAPVKKKREHRSAQSSTAPAPTPPPPTSQNCAPGASCAQSNGQQGGITAGTINVGPPPLRLDWTTSPATNGRFPYAQQVIVTANVAFQPVSLIIVCDQEIKEVSPKGFMIRSDSGVTQQSNQDWLCLL
jgi:hypothetical protein